MNLDRNNFFFRLNHWIEDQYMIFCDILDKNDFVQYLVILVLKISASVIRYYDQIV
jgi:hypothetical protein